MKTFIYEVAGIEIESVEPFGNAYKEAVKIAEMTGSEIRRSVYINGNESRYEFLGKGKVFVNMKYYEPEKALHF